MTTSLALSCNDQFPQMADSVEKLEKWGASKIAPNSMASDFSRSMPPIIGCGGFQRIFRQTYWAPLIFFMLPTPRGCKIVNRGEKRVFQQNRRRTVLPLVSAILCEPDLQRTVSFRLWCLFRTTPFFCQRTNLVTARDSAGEGNRMSRIRSKDARTKIVRPATVMYASVCKSSTSQTR